MRSQNSRWETSIQQFFRFLGVGLAILIGVATLVGTLSFFLYWISILLHPYNGALPGDLRPILLAIYTPILLAISLIETLLIWLLTRLRWISRSWGRVGLRLFGAIALLMILCLVYLFLTQQWLQCAVRWRC
ncbi:MAG TPA: hypothetical protein V6C85_10985 [Allocoleopsis sp.]